MSDSRLGHSAIALYLSRHQPEMQNTEKLLAMAHHILKSNIYKNSQNVRFSTRQLQACFTSLSMNDISLALSCMRNIYSPIIKVSRLLLLAGADANQTTDQEDQSRPAFQLPRTCGAGKILVATGPDPTVVLQVSEHS